MRSIALIRANAIAPFVGFLENIGAPVERLLLEVGLSPGMADLGEGLLPLYACLSFLTRAAQAEKLPELGLIVGQQTSFDQLGAYARLIRRGPTLHHALCELTAAISLHSSGDLLWLSGNGTHVALCHRFSTPGNAGWTHGEMFAVGMMHGAVRAAVGPGWTPDAVWLPAAATDSQKRCEDILQAPVLCFGDASAVVFPKALLGAANRACRSPDADDVDYARLRETAPAVDFAGSVQQTVAALLSEGYPDIRRTATAVGLSVRTLQRRLTETGESYSHLVDVARYEACMRLLHGDDAKMIEIAGELGYADPASFTRAFRRWTGTPPRSFRRERA